jgi:membrane protein
MWKFARNLWFYMTNEDLTLTAAALSFTTVLSLVPFLAVTLAALNYFHALDTIAPKVEATLIENFSGAAGAEGVQLIKKGITRIRNGRMGGLGAVILIVVSTRMLFGLENAFHRIWKIKNKRPLAKKLFFYWLFLLVFPFVLALWIMFFTSFGSPVEELLPFKPGYLITFFLVFLMQKGLPSQKVGIVSALTGTALSMTLLILLERTYKLISARIFSYGKVYGSLAAVPTSLLWIFLVWMAILWGAALAAAVQKGTSSSSE